MKNSDIALIILISAVSIVISYFTVNMIAGDPNDKVVSIDYLDEISGDIVEPDAEYFNPQAKNPTVEVYVGDCGALEEWNADERRCVPKDESDNPDATADNAVPTPSDDDADGDVDDASTGDE